MNAPGGVTMAAYDWRPGRVYLADQYGIDSAADVAHEMFLDSPDVDPFGWCGYAAPLVTGAEFRRWVAALARNDRNSAYALSAEIHEGDGALLYRDECGEYVWAVERLLSQQPGTVPAPLYRITGWTLHTESGDR
jgi:hypothetical protein